MAKKNQSYEEDVRDDIISWASTHVHGNEWAGIHKINCIGCAINESLANRRANPPFTAAQIRRAVAEMTLCCDDARLEPEEAADIVMAILQE
jgi:hypothetical protein